MTVSQLYNSVAQLGFENSLEEDSRFIFAVNRALLQVNAIRPATKAYVINHKPMANKIANATFKPIDKKDELYFYADNVKAYYFEADGNGIVYIEKYDSASNEWKLIAQNDLNSSKTFKAYRGLIKEDKKFTSGQIRMRFTGDYFYSVKCVAMYEYIYTDNVDDIPAYEPFTRYDIGALAEDFLTLSTPLIVETEGVSYVNQDYTIENGRVILLPHDKGGIYKVLYNRKPSPIPQSESLSNSSTILDLDEDLCALLPNLIASYIWLEDEPDKAQYYMSLYKESAIDIERRMRNTTPIQIKSCNGW